MDGLSFSDRLGLEAVEGKELQLRNRTVVASGFCTRRDESKITLAIP
jgi:hypothetical protein